jgi:hypothetical protein
MSFRPGKYDKDAMKKFDEELRARQKLERAAKVEEQRLEVKKIYEEEKEIRHKEWLNKGDAYYEKMVADEKKREDAEEFKRQLTLQRQKEKEDQQQRIKIAYAKRMEAERIEKEAEEARIAARTRWYDDGSRYEGEFLEDANYVDGVNAKDRRNLHRTPHGKGTFFNGIVERYRGDYFYGERHGQGRIICADGSVYIGTFYQGKRHGKGVWEKMTLESIERKRIAMEKAAKEADSVTEIFTLPPRPCIFHNDAFVCWWDDLIPGVMLKICLTNSYNVHSCPKWYQVTILDRRGWAPYETPEEIARKAKFESGGIKKEEEDEEEPWNEPERHQVVCAHEEPWARPRWINLVKYNFRMHRSHNKKIYNHLQEAQKRCERDAEIDKTSDPLTKEFKEHIKFKLDAFTRYRTEEREIDTGNDGTAGGDRRSVFPTLHKKKQWKTLLGGR